MYRGRNWARTGFWTGVAASVAANVAHAFVGPDGGPYSGTPSWLMLVFAALPPFALLVGIEVIAQVQWRRVWFQAVIRWCAVGGVATIGGVVSYDHMRMALLAHGETGIGSILLPILVDGLMTVCSAALLTIGDNIRRAERLVPAEIVVEPAAVVTPVATHEPAPAPAPARKAAAATVVAALRAQHPDLPQDAVAKQTGLAVRTVQRHWNVVATPRITGAQA
jgi:hypothetical protein